VLSSLRRRRSKGVVEFSESAARAIKKREVERRMLHTWAGGKQPDGMTRITCRQPLKASV
jgi:hypothetical protein